MQHQFSNRLEAGETRLEATLEQELLEQMDQFDWDQVFYDPLEANAELERYADRVAFRRLEWLVEQLTAHAQANKAAYDFVSELVHRHWQGKPMEVQIINVLNGDYVQLVQEKFYQLKKENDMNQDNLEYLKKQLLFTGFGEGLITHLEKKIKEGLPEFTLLASHAFGKDKMEAVLHFSRSKQDGSDMYFFNKYDARLEGQNGKIEQTFYINNKGKSLSFEDACQLMNGRSVFMEVTPKEGGPYKAWIKIDYSNKDENGNFKLNYFNGNYGFNLHEAVGRIPLKELGNPDRMEAIYAALQRGRLVEATLVKGGREIPVQLAADPKFKTIKLYDADGVKLFVPGPKPETQYGQAPADGKKQLDGKLLEVGEPLSNGKETKIEQANLTDGPGDSIKKKDLLPQKTAGSKLMSKNRTSKGKGINFS
jgi:hypothetical protein